MVFAERFQNRPARASDARHQGHDWRAVPAPAISDDLGADGRPRPRVLHRDRRPAGELVEPIFPESSCRRYSLVDWRCAGFVDSQFDTGRTGICGHPSSSEVEKLNCLNCAYLESGSIPSFGSLRRRRMIELLRTIEAFPCGIALGDMRFSPMTKDS